MGLIHIIIHVITEVFMSMIIILILAAIIIHQIGRIDIMDTEHQLLQMVSDIMQKMVCTGHKHHHEHVQVKRVHRVHLQAL